MADILNRVIDIAKKLRRIAKKTGDQGLQELITDLNLGLADLRVELAEQRAADTTTGDEAVLDETPAATHTGQTTQSTPSTHTGPTHAAPRAPAAPTTPTAPGTSNSLDQASTESLQWLGRRHDTPPGSQS